jgi:hypothetical protein
MLSGDEPRADVRMAERARDRVRKECLAGDRDPAPLIDRHPKLV